MKQASRTTSGWMWKYFASSLVLRWMPPQIWLGWGWSWGLQGWVGHHWNKSIWLQIKAKKDKALGQLVDGCEIPPEHLTPAIGMSKRNIWFEIAHEQFWLSTSMWQIWGKIAPERSRPRTGASRHLLYLLIMIKFIQDMYKYNS